MLLRKFIIETYFRIPKVMPIIVTMPNRGLRCPSLGRSIFVTDMAQNVARPDQRRNEHDKIKLKYIDTCYFGGRL
jgi:hypothetical protein